jgi:hypothetical protein
MNPKLIYDVGMHNGDDTAYYLRRGFRVIAIEPNPALVATAAERFRRWEDPRTLLWASAGLGSNPFWADLHARSD